MIAYVPRTIALFLGLSDPNLYTGHALRVSSATTLADEGADILELKRHGRWNSNAVAEEYVRESKFARVDAASKLSGSSLTLDTSISKASVGDHSGKNLFPNCVFNGPVYIQYAESSKKGE